MTRTMNQISIENYFNTVKPALTERENWVLRAIEDLGEASAYTAASYLEVPINMVSGRFTGLYNKGKIVKTEKRDVGTGRRAQFFRIANKVEYEYTDAE